MQGGPLWLMPQRGVQSGRATDGEGGGQPGEGEEKGCPEEGRQLH